LLDDIQVLPSPEDGVGIATEEGRHLVHPQAVPLLPVIIFVFSRKTSPFNNLMILNKDVLARINYCPLLCRATCSRSQFCQELDYLL
jgi:hypothetical protein